VAKLLADSPHTADPGARLRLVPVSEIPRRVVAMLLPDLNLPLGTVAVLCGQAGLGKSLVTFHWAARLTEQKWGVIFLAEEDEVGAVYPTPARGSGR
jgi:hypothetical protein